MKNNVKKNNKKKNQGFTIVELLVVITIIGVLSSFVSVGYFGYVKKSKETVALAEAKEIYQAIEIGLANNVFNCTTVEELVDKNITDLKTELETKCGINIVDDATIKLTDTELTYSARGVSITYKFG